MNSVRATAGDGSPLRKSTGRGVFGGQDGVQNVLSKALVFDRGCLRHHLQACCFAGAHRSCPQTRDRGKS